MPRVLYQFPISSFCEKARWNLDAKGLAFETRDLFPGVHRAVLKRLGAARTVPALVDGDAIISDSGGIVEHLERAYPERPLVPRDEPARARCAALVATFDEVGEHVRRVIWGTLLHEPGAVQRAFFRHHSLGERAAGVLAGPILEKVLRSRYRITRESVAASCAEAMFALHRIEEETRADPKRRLVGEALTIADITAASLLGPLLAPAGSPWDAVTQSAALAHLRIEARGTAGGAWVLERYRSDRLPAA